MAMAAGSSSGKSKVRTPPAVVQFGYVDFTCKPSKDASRITTTDVCRFCKDKTTISEQLGTTSNFLKHLTRCHKN